MPLLYQYKEPHETYFACHSWTCTNYDYIGLCSVFEYSIDDSRQSNLHTQHHTNAPFIPYSSSNLHAHSQYPDRKR